jgi:hypothetical protein
MVAETVAKEKRPQTRFVPLKLRTESPAPNYTTFGSCAPVEGESGLDRVRQGYLN